MRRNTSVRSSSAAVLLLAMMLSGCATASETVRDVARAQKAPAKPASTAKAEPQPPQPSCPPVSKETYQAINESTPMPPNGYNWKPQQTREWVESLEKQNAKLREQLSEEVIARGKCRS